jgi:hypothetical protein
MARNKKKSTSQQQRKRQQKEQRRSARKERQGPARSLASQAGTPKLSPFPELADYLNASANHGDIEAVIGLAWDSGDLLEEAEFDDIYVEPIAAVGALIKNAEAMGYGPDILNVGDEAVDEEVRNELMDKLWRQLVTPTLRRRLIDGLSALRKRLHSADEQALRRTAAAVQFLLEADRTDDLTPHLGFTRNLLIRGLDAGFTLVGTGTEIADIEKEGKPLSPNAFLERLTASEQGVNLEKMIADSPGLQKYLNKQIEQTQEEGLKATFTGELPLHLFTSTEIDPVLAMVRSAFSPGDARRADSRARSKVMGELIPQLLTYLAPLMTPARLAQVRRDLAARVQEAMQTDSKWLAFLSLKQNDFADLETFVDEQPFLVAALIGQVALLLYEEDAQAE